MIRQLRLQRLSPSITHPEHQQQRALEETVVVVGEEVDKAFASLAAARVDAFHVVEGEHSLEPGNLLRRRARRRGQCRLRQADTSAGGQYAAFQYQHVSIGQRRGAGGSKPLVRQPGYRRPAFTLAADPPECVPRAVPGLSVNANRRPSASRVSASMPSFSGAFSIPGGDLSGTGIPPLVWIPP